MTDQDTLLVAAMAFLAVTIVLGDLVVSWWRRRSRVARLNPVRPLAGPTPEEEAATAATSRELIRQRLAAIDAAMARPDSYQPPQVGYPPSALSRKMSDAGRRGSRSPSGEDRVTPLERSSENRR